MKHPEQDQLTAWYYLCAKSESRLALDHAVLTFERLLRAGKRNEANELLARANVKQLAPTVLVGILGITRHATPPLPARASFLQQAEAQLRTEIGDARTEKLLRRRR